MIRRTSIGVSQKVDHHPKVKHDLRVDHNLRVKHDPRVKREKKVFKKKRDKKVLEVEHEAKPKKVWKVVENEFFELLLLPREKNESKFL